ncbi:Uncharacterised protein [Mycobacteroides abscessus subsp. abscessus]|nr:Uncharacterised protein [Mycobacteroides abscessus subsp. abscessus]
MTYYPPPRYRCLNLRCPETYHPLPTCPYTPLTTVVPPRTRPLTPRERDVVDHIYRLGQAGELRILPTHRKWWVTAAVAFVLLLIMGVCVVRAPVPALREWI